MEDNRFYWKTENSTTNLVEGYLVPDMTDSQVSLQPQRIRLFKVSYN